VTVSEAFRDAEALANFANLDPSDPASVAYFRNNYPDFAPTEWWGHPYRIDGTRVLRYEDVIKLKDDPNFTTKIKDSTVQQWQYAQEQIRRAWKAGFNFKNVSEVSDLLKLVFYADRPGLLWNSSQVILPDGMIYELNSKLYSFHKAVLYLHAHPQQAKICEECWKYFVHPHGKRTLCPFPDSRGETCSQKRITARKLEWWHERGEKQRRAKRKKKRTGGSRNA
jgi:hypothetical protein